MRYITATTCAAALGLCTTAHAALIGLTAGPSPDVYTDGAQAVYTLTSPTSGTLSITGVPATIDGVDMPTTGWLAINLTIAHGANPSDPVTATSGTLSLTSDKTAGTPILYGSTDVEEFGYSTTLGLFDIVFHGDTGTLLPAGKDIGVIISDGNSLLSANTAAPYLPGLFTTSFNNTSNQTATVDVFPVPQVPEPASLALLGLGSVALLRRRRA